MERVREKSFVRTIEKKGGELKLKSPSPRDRFKMPAVYILNCSFVKEQSADQELDASKRAFQTSFGKYRGGRSEKSIKFYFPVLIERYQM